MEIIKSNLTATSRSLMSSAAPNTQDLVNAMRGRGSTNKWDIVCSYSVYQLNQFLKTQYDAGKLAKEVKLTAEVQDPFSGGNFTIDYDIFFAAPVLSFLAGQSGSAMLSMLMTGGSEYTIRETGITTVIPANQYSVQFVVPLAAISGDMGKIGVSGDIIVFSDGKQEDAHIIIHFMNANGATFQIVPLPDPKDKDPMVTYFLPALDYYFKTEVSEIDYALTSINNEQTTGNIVLTPKSFVFASAASDTGGVLSLYIQTAATRNPPGNANPSFQPGDMQILPIPDHYTASLILSYDLITNYYIKSQLEARGYGVLFVTAPDGIDARLATNTSVIANGDSGNYVFGGYSYKGLSVPIDGNNPIDFVITNSQYTLKWSGSMNSDWSEYNVSGGSWGTAHIKIKLNKGPSNFESLDNHSLNLINLTISSSDFNVKVSGGSCSVWDSMNHCSESPPSFYSKDMKLRIPDINLKLEGLDFFLETNLLSPGRQVIDIDTAAGVKTPHDFLLLGYVRVS